MRRRRPRRDFLADAVASLPPVPILDDYGEIGGGDSKAHFVSTGTDEYIAKGTIFSPHNPFVAVNEYVAAKLARRMNLPILPCEILELNGAVLFGSEYMQAGTWHPAISLALFQAAENQSCVYGLVVLDAWIGNTDRHEGNLLVRSRPGSPARRNPSKTTILLNDHSHCLVVPPSPPASAGDLAGRTAAAISGHVTGIDYIRAAILDPVLLGRALRVAEAVTAPQIDAMTRSAHPSWWPNGESDRAAFAAYLNRRRGHLRSLFGAERAIFPNLAGGPIP